MNAIKFRGKLNSNGKWVYGMPSYDLQYIFNDENLDSPDNFEVNPKTIGQFIGLIDINGNEIFEGDIIKLTGGLRLEFYPDNGTVVYNTTSFCMKAKTESGDPWHFAINFSDGTEIEVIGNIHDVKEP